MFIEEPDNQYIHLFISVLSYNHTEVGFHDSNFTTGV